MFHLFLPIFYYIHRYISPKPMTHIFTKSWKHYGDITIHFLALPLLRHFSNGLWNIGGAQRELWQLKSQVCTLPFILSDRITCFLLFFSSDIFIVPYTVPHSFCHFPCSHSPDQENTFETLQLSVIHLKEFSNCSSCLDCDQNKAI